MKIQLGVKTNGNFGGFLVGNDILSNFGISLGNPHMCAICKTYVLYELTQVVDAAVAAAAVAAAHCHHGTTVGGNFDVTS